MRPAPVAAIVAFDLKFHEQLATQFQISPTASDMFASNEARTRETALRDGRLQGTFLLLAAQSLGLDIGPMSGFNSAAVVKVIVCAPLLQLKLRLRTVRRLH